MQLLASIVVLVSGLFLALVANLDEGASDMRLFGWLLIVVGLFGLALRIVVPRLNRRGWPREPGPPRGHS